MIASAHEVPSVEPIPIPKTIGEIGAVWLTEALRTRFAGLVVESADIRQSLGGACTKLRVAIHTNRVNFPSSIIVKGCFEAHNQEMMPWLQRNEANLYTHMVPHLNGVGTVGCFFAQGNETYGSALILEDLNARGVRCLRIQDPICDYDVAARFIDHLARLHARWWNGPELTDRGLFGWLPGSSSPKLFEFKEERLSDEAFMADLLNRPRAAAIPIRLHDRKRLIKACDVMRSIAQKGPRVLAHGDPHLANLFVTADGEPGFLDWSCVRVPWMFDVAYFIIGSLDVCDRREWEQPLLDHYFSRLTSFGIELPPFDEAWSDYRRWALWGLIGWLINSTDYHSEASITAMASRFGAAVAEHGSLELLGECI
jgi:hypothetical protein